MKFKDGFMQPEIGDFVYKAYKPQTPGKVVNLLDGFVKKGLDGKEFKTAAYAEVKWVDGKTNFVNILSLQDFKSLIADHEKKLQTHKSKLALLEAL